MYLASDSDGSGPWLYSMDVDRRIPHRLTSGLDRYTSLAASADGRRLVVTLASPKRTLWRLRIADSPQRSFGACSHLAHHQHRFLSATRPGLSSVCFCHRRQREYLEARQRRRHGIVEWPGRANFWRPGNLLRWTPRRILGPATREDPPVRDAVRRHERARCRRFARPARRSGLGARWPIAHLGCERSRRPSPLPCTARRSRSRRFLSRSTQSIPPGRPTANSLSTRDPTSARHFR